MTPFTGEDDGLISLAKQGDKRALEQLLREIQPHVYGVCRRITTNDADALDATQNALISIVRAISDFDGRSKFSSWCYRIATNSALDELRRQKRHRSPVSIDSTEYVGEPADHHATDAFGQVEDRYEIDLALGELSGDFRAAVVLRDLCQLDYNEIAEVLEIAPGTVRSRIARARAQLAEKLSGNQPGTSQRPTSAS
ncbi:MAG: RNA polymerase sigma factor [Acidimicrobiales bacterium]|nr:RNA polymerase sigma factor [Acidimicrobiales bacterium]